MKHSADDRVLFHCPSCRVASKEEECWLCGGPAYLRIINIPEDSVPDEFWRNEE